jgi:uncharacterized protein YgbK (DUF1537 family)
MTSPGDPGNPGNRHDPGDLDRPGDLDGPAPLEIPDARARIRAAHRTTGRRIAVLDDDPTGSQTVHDVQVVFALEPAEYARGLAAAGDTCFVLTNSRSLSEPDATRLALAVGRDLAELERRSGAPITVVSRSDSTLRGHLMAEVEALDAARRAVTGAGYDGVLLVPAYLEAGRFTAGDVHWAMVGGRPVPVGETEFARDATFGYAASDLRDWVAEKSTGRIRADDVLGLSLDDVRRGGPDRVAELLSGVRGGRFVVVNATCYADLEVVVLGLIEAERAGRTFLPRCGPSFVRALAGLDPQPPLTGDRIWPPGGAPATTGRHGLVVVGSHVGLTNRQVEVALGRGGMTEIRLDVPTLLDPGTRDRELADVTGRVQAALGGSDVLLITSRTLVTGPDGVGSLAIARAVSGALTEVVSGVMASGDGRSRPSWVIAKGGITSHDVAVTGLGIRRAVVLGQLLPGLVSVFRPVGQVGQVGDRLPRFVVFAGNVGDERTLADVIDRIRG